MLKIQIAKTESVLNNLVLNEPVDMEILNLLINSTILRKEETVNGEWKEDELALLKKYKGLCVNEDGLWFAKVKYVRTKWCGRVWADKGVGLCPMRWEVRHTLANAVGFVDIDIKNCHPEILVQICRKNGLSCDAMADYVKNRDNYLAKMMESIPNLSRCSAKTLPIRIMYLGSLQNWAGDEGVNLGDIPDWLHEWSDKVADELKKIADFVVENNPKFVKEVVKGTHSASWNKISAVLSFFLQEYENRVLESIYVYCYNNGFIKNNVAVLCYDGIMLKESELPTDILKTLSAEVKKKTELVLALETKAFEKAMTRADLEKVQMSPELLAKDKLGKFDTPYFISLDNYGMKKLYFENFVCKVLRPDPTYVYIESDGAEGSEGLCFYNQAKIGETFGHLNSGIKNCDGVDIKFMAIWLKDETIRQYNRMDFIPYNDRNPIDKTVFNLFRGFSPLIHTPFKINKTETILKPFHELGIQLCGGDKEHYKYLTMYIADIFQNPQKKNPIAFIIKGKQGAGKNVWLNAIGQTLGAHHYITSSNPKDFFGDYAEGFFHKLLVNMNECEGRDTFDFEGKIKSFITEDTITLNRKFVQPITILNLARLIIFTNKPNPIPIDVRSKDRRYTVFETTDEYLKSKYGSKFWTGLIAHIKSPIFRACLYNYYNTLDLSSFDVRKRPITNAYLEMCRLYIPVEVLFLATKIEKAKIADDLIWSVYSGNGGSGETPTLALNTWFHKGITGEDLYAEYIDYCKKYGFYKDNGSYQKHIKSFYAKIAELELPIFQNKGGNIIQYKFKGDEVLTMMKEKKWIDYDKDDAIAEIVEETGGEEFDGYFQLD